ncbi:MAG: gliding motility-associated C-terminal domain-containing protein [Prevotella sp.]|nr:gliding motility-associated C-terminal domain-containing protein [Prevotella sp.]
MLMSGLWLVTPAMAQDSELRPTIDPYGVSTSDEGEEETGKTFSGSAPKTVKFYANAQNTVGWTPYYEWRFFLTTLDGVESETPYLIRYEEDTEYTFTKAGLNKIMCYATFVNGTDTISFTDEYWSESEPLTVSVSESKLDMPNAFSPNGDGINDIYRAKRDYQSIIEFHAYIFNRWGQKLFEWTDPAEGWDGTYNGKDVKQGVYYCLVKAKGADGRKFNIHTDVNLLRGYTEDTGVNSTE